MARALTVSRLLQGQGFGSRKECARLVKDGRVAIGGKVVDDVEVNVEGLRFTVDGAEWRWREHVLVLLNKPAGVECSARPQHHRSVLELLPPQLVARGVQPVGRLDVDTTGLLLLSDDGDFVHAMTSPKKHVPKTYRVTTAEDLTEVQVATLRSGVTLSGEDAPTASLAVVHVGPRAIDLTIDEGKYHQVKRMLAAAGNHVTALHRIRVGSYELPGDLEPGGWRYVER